MTVTFHETPQLKKVGAIGWPIEHSLSPAMHNAAFAALGMTDWFYDKMAIPPDVLRLSLRELMQHGYIGINVTVPHKEAVLPFVKADSVAQAVGAVNTIDFRTNTGTNTDVQGFIGDLAAHSIDVTGKSVLVLGAGGSARAVVYGLAQAGARVQIINRTPERAERLLRDLGVSGEVTTFEQVGEGEPPALMVNSTSVGMLPNVDESPWPEGVPFPRGMTIYDLIYRPAHTRLMALAEANGGWAINGVGMLVRQGGAAFRIWTGVEPPLDVMFEAVREALQQKSS